MAMRGLQQCAGQRKLSGFRLQASGRLQASAQVGMGFAGELRCIFTHRARNEAKPMFLKVQDLVVYQRLCDLHLEICDHTRGWPVEEKYELSSQVRRSSNSAPAQLAERHGDRHARKRIEGVNNSRDEANETVHHLYIGFRKRYLSDETFKNLVQRYEECIRMLNGLERSFEQSLPERERKWTAEPEA
jgi:four helix bundle protein